jgi:hypothetical protein
VTPKEAALRKSPARYWPHTRRDVPPTNDELLRAQRIERERRGMDLTSALCGDPPPSRKQVMHLQRDAQGCYVPAEYED